MINETRIRILKFRITKKPELFEHSWIKTRPSGEIEFGRELLPILVSIK